LGILSDVKGVLKRIVTVLYGMYQYCTYSTVQYRTALEFEALLLWSQAGWA